MAITFFTHSVKENSPIWVRVRESKTDAKTRTLITVPTDRLVKGKILLHRITSGEPQHKVIMRQKNDALNIVQEKMDSLKREIQNALNNRSADDIINKDWLKNVVQPSKNTNLLSTNIEAFLDFKKSRIEQNTFIIYKALERLLNSFEKEHKTTLIVGKLDLNFRDKFLKYLNDNGYSNGTIILYIRTLVQILKFAKKRGVKISNDLEFFKEGLKKKKTLNVYLTLEEIDKIYKLEGLSAKEDIARDWLVISCNTAQRVGDLFNFNKSNLNAEGDVLTVQQTKNQNSKPIQIPLLPQVLEILQKYNGDFPPLLSNVVKNNFNYYGKLIKEICKKAKLNDEIKTLQYKSAKNNSGVVTKKKWELVSSHCGRRSFCSNMYGKIPTPLLMMISGHKEESTLLLYIDRDRIIDIPNLRAMMLKASEQ